MIKKNPAILVEQILESIDLIKFYTSSLTEQEFNNKSMVRDAVLMHLIVIGEAAHKLPEDFKKEHSTIEWMRITRTRHIIAHEYGRVDFTVIWRIITLHLPQTESYLRNLYSEL
jgi:uncharacterized protein with HEPN domain